MRTEIAQQGAQARHGLESQAAGIGRWVSHRLPEVGTMRWAACLGCRRALVAGLAAAATLLVCDSVLWAQAGSGIVRVEEDWELVVLDPNAAVYAPQVVTAISATDDVNSPYATFEINHRTQPDFAPGGLQVVGWHFEEPVVRKRFVGEGLLQTPGEVVRWTQVMRLDGGQLTFEVINGTSQTWGAFGGNGTLKVSLTTTLANLNSYNPAVSVANSGISFAANRVQKLALKQVRWYTSAGLLATDETVRTVHELAP
jgi:hypothetical protein